MQKQTGTRHDGRETLAGRRPSERRGTSDVADSVHIADDRRRDLLRYLAGRSTATVADAAEQITAWDRKVDPDDVAAEHRGSVREDLLRNHLPRLRACGLVEYDETDGTVALTDSGDAVVEK